MKCKKYAVFLLSVCFILVLCAWSSAAEDMEAYCDSATGQAGKTIVLPLRTKNNLGLMGFHMQVSYDPAVLKEPNVVSGELTKDGMLNDSIAVAEDGLFEVVWTHTAGVKGDGTLVSLSFLVADAAKTAEVQIRFVPQDTFTENWETVEIVPLTIPIQIVSTQQEPITKPPDILPSDASATQPDTENDVRQDVLIEAVEKTLAEENITKISDVPEEKKDQFVARTNELADQLSAGQIEPFESYDELYPAYVQAVQNDFIESVLHNIDEETIHRVIEDALLQSDSSFTLGDIEQEQFERYVEIIEKALITKASDIDSLSQRIDPHEAKRAIDELESIVDADYFQRKEKNITINTDEKSVKLSMPIWKVILILSSFFLLFILFLIIRFNKKKHI